MRWGEVTGKVQENKERRNVQILEPDIRYFNCAFSCPVFVDLDLFNLILI